MSPDASGVLGRDAVRLGLSATDKEDALRQCGAVLVEIGAVDTAYVDAMLEREQSVSTYMGRASPSRTAPTRAASTSTATRWRSCSSPTASTGTASSARSRSRSRSKSDEHIGILQSLAMVLSDRESAQRLRETTSVDEVLELLTAADEDD